MKTITSLYHLRGTLREALLKALPGVEVLSSLPTVRTPVPQETTLLVIGVQSLSRSAALLDPADGLVLEVGLRFTVCHRDDRASCEETTEALAALSLAGELPFPVLRLESGAAEYNRALGAFTQKTDCTLACLLENGSGEVTP